MASYRCFAHGTMHFQHCEMPDMLVLLDQSSPSFFRSYAQNLKMGTPTAVL
jgi:hypothetical protein